MNHQGHNHSWNECVMRLTREKPTPSPPTTTHTTHHSPLTTTEQYTPPRTQIKHDKWNIGVQKTMFMHVTSHGFLRVHAGALPWWFHTANKHTALHKITPGNRESALSSFVNTSFFRFFNNNNCQSKTHFVSNFWKINYSNPKFCSVILLLLRYADRNKPCFRWMNVRSQFGPIQVLLKLLRIVFPITMRLMGDRISFVQEVPRDLYFRNFFGHVCRARRIQTSGHSDFRIFEQTGSVLHFYLSVRRYCISCLSITTW